MVWDQLPAQTKILIKQNYQHTVVPEGENHSLHTVSTPVFVSLALLHTHPPHLRDMHWACPAKLPPAIPPEPLLEHTLNWATSSALPCPWGPCSWEREGKQLYEYHINQSKINH